jgi:hypothetical protein
MFSCSCCPCPGLAVPSNYPDGDNIQQPASCIQTSHWIRRDHRAQSPRNECRPRSHGYVGSSSTVVLWPSSTLHPSRCIESKSLNIRSRCLHTGSADEGRTLNKMHRRRRAPRPRSIAQKREVESTDTSQFRFLCVFVLGGGGGRLYTPRARAHQFTAPGGRGGGGAPPAYPKSSQSSCGGR